MTFASPDDLNRVISKLRDDLEAAGLEGASQELGRIQGAAFTTGSEWLGDLGMAVRRIRSEGAIPPELDTQLERIMAEVRRVWPAL